MEAPYLRIIHPGSIIIPFKSTTVAELLILLLLAVIQVFVFSVVWFECLTAYPRHRQTKRIIMRLSKLFAISLSAAC